MLRLTNTTTLSIAKMPITISPAPPTAISSLIGPANVLVSSSTGAWVP